MDRPQSGKRRAREDLRVVDRGLPQGGISGVIGRGEQELGPLLLPQGGRPPTSGVGLIILASTDHSLHPPFSPRSIGIPGEIFHGMLSRIGNVSGEPGDELRRGDSLRALGAVIGVGIFSLLAYCAS